MESDTNPNQSGNAIARILENSDIVVLNTPHNFNTRIEPHSNKASTLDLTLSSSNLVTYMNLHIGPYWSSDHLPVYVDINKNLIPQRTYNARWYPRQSKWTEWNQIINKSLTKIMPTVTENTQPKELNEKWIHVVVEANNSLFHPRENLNLHPEPKRAWWTIECKKITAEVKKARCTWLKSPCTINKINLNRLESKKKNTILEKKRSLGQLHQTLDPKTSCKSIWKFTTYMCGTSKRTKITNYPIKDGPNNT